MEVLGLPESRHTLCLKCYAQCASILLVFLAKAEAGIENKEKLRSVEASHDPKAHRMVIQGLEIKIPLEIVTSGRSRTKFERPMESSRSRGKWEEISHMVKELDMVVAEQKTLVPKAARRVPKEKLRYSK